MEKQKNTCTEQARSVPKLRFPEFKEAWNNKKLGEISLKINSGKTPLGGESVYTNQGVLFIRSQNVIDNELNLDNSTFISEEINNTMRNSIVKPKDILLNITGASLGRSCVVPNKIKSGNVNQHVCIIRIDNFNEPYFIQPILSSQKLQNIFSSIQTGSGREGLNFESIKKIHLNLPTLPEQQKIAAFLTSVDERIAQLTKKKALLEQYKKGVMQKIFSQEIRFKDDNGKEFGEWEEKELCEISDRKTNKNKTSKITFVLSNSATQGIVSQTEYFDKDIANQNNLEGYYIVDIDDFVYNPRISNTAPVGPIKRNKLCLGVMSPLYTVFRFNQGVFEFFEYYFETSNWHEYLKGVANYGVRFDRMNITNSDFYKMPIPFPCTEEQTKIANFLSAIDKKIEGVAEVLEATQRWKKGLLQQMFC